MTDYTDTHRPEMDLDACITEIARLRAKQLRQAAIAGAGAALLEAIHRAGGYHVADPAHQPQIQHAMRALELALRDVGSA